MDNAIAPTAKLVSAYGTGRKSLRRICANMRLVLATGTVASTIHSRFSRDVSSRRALAKEGTNRAMRRLTTTADKARKPIHVVVSRRLATSDSSSNQNLVSAVSPPRMAMPAASVAIVETKASRLYSSGRNTWV